MTDKKPDTIYKKRYLHTLQVQKAEIESRGGEPKYIVLGQAARQDLVANIVPQWLRDTYGDKQLGDIGTVMLGCEIVLLADGFMPDFCEMVERGRVAWQAHQVDSDK